MQGQSPDVFLDECDATIAALDGVVDVQCMDIQGYNRAVVSFSGPQESLDALGVILNNGVEFWGHIWVKAVEKSDGIWQLGRTGIEIKHAFSKWTLGRRPEGLFETDGVGEPYRFLASNKEHFLARGGINEDFCVLFLADFDPKDLPKDLQKNLPKDNNAVFPIGSGSGRVRQLTKSLMEHIVLDGSIYQKLSECEGRELTVFGVGIGGSIAELFSYMHTARLLGQYSVPANMRITTTVTFGQQRLWKNCPTDNSVKVVQFYTRLVGKNGKLDLKKFYPNLYEPNDSFLTIGKCDQNETVQVVHVKEKAQNAADLKRWEHYKNGF